MEQKQISHAMSKAAQKALDAAAYERMNLPNQDKFEASFDRMLNPPGELIQAIPLSDIQPFPDHPFRVEEGAEMEQLKQSIRENGIMSPAIVRPMPGGSFQMISGHRRMAACKALGLERMPAIVRDMDDDTATDMMVEANLQRERILPRPACRTLPCGVKTAVTDWRPLSSPRPLCGQRKPIGISTGSSPTRATTPYRSIQ